MVIYIFDLVLQQSEENYTVQVCIPVGCIPPACCTGDGEVVAWGFCLVGVCPGDASQHAVWQTPPYSTMLICLRSETDV